MRIDWDDRKNAANFAKHGVWFEYAALVILAPGSLVAANGDAFDARMEYLGHSKHYGLLYIVTVEDADDHIRIISARKATKKEKKVYEERL